jgi:GTP pyrophosphokinase|tara:strand:+ start:1185 stop:3383 length:2199 start_codon:yes stop_codon:yes gene_type:complete
MIQTTKIHHTSDKFIQTLGAYMTPSSVKNVTEAYEFARLSHGEQKRMSGEPYIVHPVATAQHLAAMRLDSTTIIAALLHDVMEDCNVSYDTLRSKFGNEVAHLVDGATKLKHLDGLANGSQMAKQRQNPENRRSANLRKMLVAMAQDVRVILIKLSDRLHNMQTLKYLPENRRKRIARETLDIHAPLAHRLGMNEIKWQLEDEAFRYLMPDEYKLVSKLVARKRAEREQYVNAAVQTIKSELDKSIIESTVYGRAKHLYSIYDKLNRYQKMGKKFDEIHDLIAIRILTEQTDECYGALGVVHTKWRPVNGEFDDYIANPKENMYQSLHTSVMGPGNFPLEVQIRTKNMDKIAQEGVASHWSYKENEVGAPNSEGFEQQMTWLRRILEWQQELSGDEEYLTSVKTDLLGDQIFSYTPKGDVIDLPIGATPLDFAYRIHTELGHNTSGAHINGKMVALNTLLQNGDVVEIKKSHKAKGPSLDWLNPNLHYLSSAGAQSKVRQWFRKQDKKAIIRQGRNILQKELMRLGIESSEPFIASELGMNSVTELLEQLGSARMPVSRIAEAIDFNETNKNLDKGTFRTVTESKSKGLVVMGEPDTLTRIARCCSPLHGDEIIGYLTRGQGVTVHRLSCNNTPYPIAPEKVIEVNWGQRANTHPARLTLDAYDRIGLIRDITEVVSSEGINIHRVSSREDEGSNAVTIALTVYIVGVEQLSTLFSKLEAIPSVGSVIRINE